MAEPQTREEMLDAADDAERICRAWDASGAEKSSAYWRIASSASYWRERAAKFQ